MESLTCPPCPPLALSHLTLSRSLSLAAWAYAEHVFDVSLDRKQWKQKEMSRAELRHKKKASRDTRREVGKAKRECRGRGRCRRGRERCRRGRERCRRGTERCRRGSRKTERSRTCKCSWKKSAQQSFLLLTVKNGDTSYTCICKACVCMCVGCFGLCSCLTPFTHSGSKAGRQAGPLEITNCWSLGNLLLKIYGRKYKKRVQSNERSVERETASTRIECSNNFLEVLNEDTKVSKARQVNK